MNVVTSFGLLGEDTPPPAVSLICEAPSISCSRTRDAHFVGAVGDHGMADLLAARKSVARARHFERHPEVAVAAGDGDHRARGIDARTGDDAFIDGALEAEAVPAHVAHGREATHQRVGRLGAGQEVDVTVLQPRPWPPTTAAPSSCASACRSTRASACARCR